MHPLPPRCALAALALLLTGCPKPPTHEGPHLRLSNQVGDAVSRADAPELPADLRLIQVEHGVALVSIPVRAAEGTRIGSGAEALTVWSLPFPVAEDAYAAEQQPRFEGFDVPRFVPGPGARPHPATGGFYLNQVERELVLGAPAAGELPESWRLVYPILAAHLVGSEVLAEVEPAAIHHARHVRGEVAVDGLAVRAGTELTFGIPAFSAGRFLTRLAAGELGTKSKGVLVTVSVRLDGELIYEGETQVGGEPIDVEAAVGTRRKPCEVRIAVDGPRDVLVFLEEPLLARARDHNDTSNALLIVVDTLRADRLTVHGSRKNLTPHIDRLQKQSIAFGSCWSCSSWTLPSVATILTSTYPPQHGAVLNTRRLGKGVDTVAEAFRGSGYRTAAFTGGGFVSSAYGLARGFTTFDGRGGGVEAVLARANEWLDRAGSGPWFVMIHTYEVHAPYEPPKEAYEQVMRTHRQTLGRTSPEPHLFYARVQKRPQDLPSVAAALEALYDEEVRYTDQQLGLFFDQLSARGEFKDTAIVLTSDHGEEFGEHGLLGHGDTLYVEQLHVPFLLHLPRERRRGEIVWEPSSHIDLVPTLLDAAGQFDLIAAGTFNGQSLLRGERSVRPFASRSEADTGQLRAFRQLNQVLIEGEYVYPRHVQNPELYDIANDPAQARNLAQSDARSLTRMLKALDQGMAFLGKQLAEISEVTPDANKLVELQALGYADKE